MHTLRQDHESTVLRRRTTRLFSERPATALSRLHDRLVAWPIWLRVGAIGLVGRLLSLGLLIATFFIAHGLGWTGMDATHPVPTALDFLGMWDGRWYVEIAQQGYPQTLPLVRGEVGQNAWAFMPVFPAVARALMGTGMGFVAAGALVSMACAVAATIVLHRLVSLRVSPRQAWWAAVFFAFSPWSFVFSTAYAESLFVLLSMGALLFIERRRYELATVLILVAAFTRPGALALSLVLGIHLVVRLRARRTDGLPARDIVRIVAAGITTSIAGLSWPLIAAVVTGRADAYIATETAWWSNTIYDPHFLPLTPWFLVGHQYAGLAGIAAVVVVVVLTALWLCAPSVRRLGHVTLGYLWAYALYLFAVFLPQQSLPRVMLPLAPFFADERLTRSRRVRWAILWCFFLGQPLIIAILWLRGAP